jgi:hypothetical protein
MSTIKGPAAPNYTAPAAESRSTAAPAFTFSAAERADLVKTGVLGRFKDPAGGADIKTYMLQDPKRVETVLDKVQGQVQAWQNSQSPRPTAEQVKAKASEFMKAAVSDEGVSKMMSDFRFNQFMKKMREKQEDSFSE